MSGVTSIGGRMRFGMDLVATLAAVAGCALVLWLNWDKVFPPGPRLPKTPISLQGASVKGGAAAPVVLIEFSDYVCPFCAKFETEILPEITKHYIDTGDVQLAFRHHPLEQLHPGATKAAEAALCAGREGKFWEMHAALFALLQRQKNAGEASVMASARELALDEKSFGTCLAGEVTNQVRTDAREAETLGLFGTPAFLVGRREPDGRVRIAAVLNGVRPVADFEKVISEVLKASRRGDSTASYLLAGGGAVLTVAAWFGVRRRQTKARGSIGGGCT